MSISIFIQDFFKRKGGYVLSAVVLSKLLSLLLSVFLIRILTKQDYGNLMYAYTVISFIMPFMGMGIFQSFLKYAPIQEFMYQRKKLFRYIFIGGSLASFILIVLLLILAPFITSNVPNAYLYLLGFSLLIWTLFIFESVKNYLRIFYLNKAYARLEIIHALLIFVSATLLTFYIGAIGFVFAIVLTPLLLSLWLLLSKNLLNDGNTKTKFNVSTKKLWSYGIYTSLGGLVSQLIFSVDLLSIGNLLEDAKWVAQYKALSLIPFSLMFLPSVILKTDFVKLVQEAKNKIYLIQYVKNFMFLFSIISIFLIVTIYFLDNWIIRVFFGEDYLEQSNLLMIFTFGIVGAFLFRVPFGNLMVAIGWTKINTIISIITLLADIILNYFWIQKWGIWGAAYATSLLLWFSGIATFFIFIFYISKLKN